jgi:hypothetical protein
MRLVVHSGAYSLWLGFNRPSSRIYKSATEETNRLKKRVRKKRMKNAEKKLGEEEWRSRRAMVATAAAATRNKTSLPAGGNAGLRHTQMTPRQVVGHSTEHIISPTLVIIVAYNYLIV